jgi:hypothetical protein
MLKADAIGAEENASVTSVDLAPSSPSVNAVAAFTHFTYCCIFASLAVQHG